MAIPPIKQYGFEAGIIGLLSGSAGLHRPMSSLTCQGGNALVSGWQSPLEGLECTTHAQCNTHAQHIDLCDKIMKAEVTAGIDQWKSIFLT